MAGVMFTKTGHSGAYSGCVEIGTKKGLGIRVVEGHAEPELTFYCGEGRISSVNPSKDDKMLHFGENGGVIETGTAPGGFLLSKDMIRRLAEAGLEIEKKFNGIPQDIEWLVIGNTIYIVQARPYTQD
ncbi:MAG: hypothetical protein A2021_04500 [Elusimicrobia bacterium GWF2_52_66]|nr:MAG: hypothetical protein A2X33_08465 [Elusimicrobia bacterium GWA2_51_34]OGR86272.1 MAG: hypothetical protein A2021_04500 [Elusimicrobia bacterium GWF2_52_66]